MSALVAQVQENNLIVANLLGTNAYIKTMTDCESAKKTDFETIKLVLDDIVIQRDSMETILTGRNQMIYNWLKPYTESDIATTYQFCNDAIALIDSDTCEQIENRLINGRLFFVRNSQKRLLDSHLRFKQYFK